METKPNPNPADQPLTTAERIQKSRKNLSSLQQDAVPSAFRACDTKEREFEIVNGRLGMGACQPSYRVTIDEMARRINGAEKLNSSNMACNLRRSKVKNGGELMRRQLEDHNIEVTLNQRQKAFPSKLISLVEAEACHMAQDLEEIIEEDYPVKDIGKEVAEEAMKDGMDEFFDKDSFLECMSAMQDVFASVVPPISGIVPRASDNKTLNHGLEDFSSMTHGLGIVCNPMWLQQITKIGEEACKEIENKKNNQQ